MQLILEVQLTYNFKPCTNGSAKSAIEELEHVIGDIGDLGTALGLPNSNQIKQHQICYVWSGVYTEVI